MKRIRLWRDCVGGYSSTSNSEEVDITDPEWLAEVWQYCADLGDEQFSPDDKGSTFEWGDGHGTKTACILSGTHLLGNEYRGVTAAQIDSWRISHISSGTVDTSKIEDAVLAAIVHGATVIVAELALNSSNYPPHSSMAKAFDMAYDLGVPVIAAVGNHGLTGGPGCDDISWPQIFSVGCPANAHKVISVGYFDPEQPNELSCAQAGSCFQNADRMRQSLGPVKEDGRTKPDILAPTRTVTGARESEFLPGDPLDGIPESKQALGMFCHSSGATPYAAGACLLLQDFFNTNGLGQEPGKLYAALIAFGSVGDLGSFLNKIMSPLNGAGRLRLGNPTNSFWCSGMRYIKEHSLQNSFMFYIPKGAQNLHAAIWWPEEPAAPRETEVHNEIHLQLFDSHPVPEVQGFSDLANSVFQKVRIEGAISPSGYWRFSIVPQDIQNDTGYQKVYYFLYFET